MTLPSPLRSSAAVFAAIVFALSAFAFACTALAQSNAGTVTGTVTDTTGALLPGATVQISNSVSGYSRNTTTDAGGHFQFVNVPMNPYQLGVSASGFQAKTVPVVIKSAIAVSTNIQLAVGSSTTVNVDATADLIETDPELHTDVDRTEIERLPVESPSSQLSSIVTELSPGVSADSDGQLHGMGDHNEVSFSVDGQAITDQQSKVFSNQLPASAVQSLQVISGAPPAEYGDKTSMVIVATTRSGQGITRPTGSVTLSYGGFGTANVSADLAYGGQNWGNFIVASGLQSGRFLDAPEFAVMHDKGNEENVFDRVDYAFSPKSSMHTNLQYTRSWFQTPNSFDTQSVYAGQGFTPGPTDQRSKIETISFSPTYTRVLSDNTVLNIAPYLRRDSFNYYPSHNALADLGPIQQESVTQYRSLMNTGLRTDLSYAKGANNAKFGAMYQQTFLRENLHIGIVDPTLNAPGSATFSQVLAAYDLTRGGSEYGWHGQTDIKQLALYGEDSITAGHWLFSLGIRGDIYNGLAIQRQGEPRTGISYTFPKLGTVLRVSYARTQETPFNENLVLSAKGCFDPVLNAIFSGIGQCNAAPFNPGFRNEFHAGFSQSAGKHFVVSAEYITKYTHNGFDFSVLGATPITFPIEWHNSKIPGYAGSIAVTNVKGLNLHYNFSSVTARFFNPQIGGVGATIAAPGGFPFRIDHDERFNQDVHLEYKMPFRKSLYYSFNWRFDSGEVAGSVPCYGTSDPNSACLAYSFTSTGTPLTVNGKPAVDLSSLTADEEFQAGLTCDGRAATPTVGFTICDATGLTSKLVNIPAPGTQNNDRSPQRIAARSLFDMALGDDKIIKFGKDRYSLGATLTAINVTNKYALYNFLSTFSGTHYVTPRTMTAEIAFHF